MGARWLTQASDHRLGNRRGVFGARIVGSDDHAVCQLFRDPAHHGAFAGIAIASGAFVFALLPRNKTPLQLAALTGVLLLGFELVLTHWFYLYIPWFFPFVVAALFLPGRREPA